MIDQTPFKLCEWNGALAWNLPKGEGNMMHDGQGTLFFAVCHNIATIFTDDDRYPQQTIRLKCLWILSLFLSQILIGEVTGFFVKSKGAQERTIVTADCCYFNPLLRRIVRFLGQLLWKIRDCLALAKQSLYFMGAEVFRSSSPLSKRLEDPSFIVKVYCGLISSAHLFVSFCVLLLHHLKIYVSYDYVIWNLKAKAMFLRPFTPIKTTDNKNIYLMYKICFFLLPLSLVHRL